MKPLPIQPRTLPAAPTTGATWTGLPARRATRPAARPAAHPSDRRPSLTQPVLLVVSTLLAAAFCILYLTKPVVRIAAAEPTRPAPADPTPAAAPAAPAPTDLTAPAAETTAPDEPAAPSAPAADAPASGAPLPADPADLAAAGATRPSPDAKFEETNLKVQHVLSVVAPEGEIGRVVTEVPVIYQTRTLRWDQTQVAAARNLLAALQAHQQKARALRAEGIALLDAWQALVAGSIPAAALRADSPTLPANQSGESGRRGPAGLETSKSIEVKTATTR